MNEVGEVLRGWILCIFCCSPDRIYKELLWVWEGKKKDCCFLNWRKETLIALSDREKIEDVWAEQKKKDMNNCHGLSEKLENVM